MAIDPPRRRRTPLVGLAVAAVVGAMTGAGCVEAAPTLDPLPLADDCRCQQAADGVCPVDVCDVRLEVEAATCLGELQVVEVLLDNTLEPAVFRPGGAQRSCRTIARGASALLHARADSGWRWQEQISCPAAAAGETQGPTVERVLHCATGP